MRLRVESCEASRSFQGSETWWPHSERFPHMDSATSDVNQPLLDAWHQHTHMLRGARMNDWRTLNRRLINIRFKKNNQIKFYLLWSHWYISCRYYWQLSAYCKNIAIGLCVLWHALILKTVLRTDKNARTSDVKQCIMLIVQQRAVRYSVANKWSVNCSSHWHLY